MMINLFKYRTGREAAGKVWISRVTHKTSGKMAGVMTHSIIHHFGEIQMTLQLFDAEILGNQAQALLNDQFITDNPGKDLPNIAWFGVWCLKDTDEPYWNPEETDTLNKSSTNCSIWQGSPAMAGQFMYAGWSPPESASISSTLAAMRRCPMCSQNCSLYHRI